MQQHWYWPLFDHIGTRAKRKKERRFEYISAFTSHTDKRAHRQISPNHAMHRYLFWSMPSNGSGPICTRYQTSSIDTSVNQYTTPQLEQLRCPSREGSFYKYGKPIANLGNGYASTKKLFEASPKIAECIIFLRSVTSTRIAVSPRRSCSE